MTRVEAIEVLIREGQRENVTKAGHKRVLAACKALGLDDKETAHVEAVLEYSSPQRKE